MGPRKLADLIQALLAFLGRNDMMAYPAMMAIRLATRASLSGEVGSQSDPANGAATARNACCFGVQALVACAE